MQCQAKECQGRGSKVHTLTRKSQSLCIHTFLVFKAGLMPEENIDNVSEPSHEVNRRSTIDEVVKYVKLHLPTAMSEERNNFIKISKKFMDNLLESEDINSEIEKHYPTECTLCRSSLLPWTHKTKTSYLISFCAIREIKMNPRICPECKVLFYPNLYSWGILPLHNKVICISFLPCLSTFRSTLD